MSDETNEEEAWLHSVMRDFNYIVISGRYGPLFYELLTDDAKLIIQNMYLLEKNNVIGIKHIRYMKAQLKEILK
jgi:hypothetical protein